MIKFPKGKLSTQSKFKKPNISICFKVDSIAVGVEIKRMMKIVKACNIKRLNINKPRLEPPMFFHIISIGSLARLIKSTSSFILVTCYSIYAS